MLDFLVSLPAIVNRAECREVNPYVVIQQEHAGIDFSADGILRDAMTRTRIQFDRAYQAVIGEQEDAKRAAAA